MHYNFVDWVLNKTLNKNHEQVSDYTTSVQTDLNEQAGIGIKAQTPPVNQDRIDGLVENILSKDDFNEVKENLNESVVNYTQSIVDDSIKENSEFQHEAGLSSKIIRNSRGAATTGVASWPGATTTKTSTPLATTYSAGTSTVGARWNWISGAANGKTFTRKQRDR